MKLRSLAALAALLSFVAPALAHFPWVAVDKDSSGQPAAHVWFAELAEPDAAKLLDKITAIKVWTRKAGEKPSQIAVTKQTEGDLVRTGWRGSGRNIEPVGAHQVRRHHPPRADHAAAGTMPSISKARPKT